MIHKCLETFTQVLGVFQKKYWVFWLVGSRKFEMPLQQTTVFPDALGPLKVAQMRMFDDFEQNL